jgi:hypothetical protein
MVARVHDTQHFEDVSFVPLIEIPNYASGLLILPWDTHASPSRKAPIDSLIPVGRAQTEAK